MLLKVVLFAYAQGIVSSPGIERACREHVTFIALCGDRGPHCTTIAHFVSTLGDDIARVFAAVVAICDAQGLIGREMFAIDGVKLPSNTSKHRSGTRADFARQAAKLEAATTLMVQQHRAADALPTEPDLAVKATQRLERDAAQMRDWLAAHPEDRRGPKGIGDHVRGRKRGARGTGRVRMIGAPRQYGHEGVDHPARVRRSLAVAES